MWMLVFGKDRWREGEVNLEGASGREEEEERWGNNRRRWRDEREKSKRSRWMMLLDSISCLTVLPAIGRSAGSLGSACSSTWLCLCLFSSCYSCVCVRVCAHCEINSAQLIRMRLKMRRGHTWAHLSLHPFQSLPLLFLLLSELLRCFAILF